MLKKSPGSAKSIKFSQHESGVTHVLVTGGAGYIGSHAVLCLLRDSYRVTIADNLSRGNMGAVKILQGLYPEPGRIDLGDAAATVKEAGCASLFVLVMFTVFCYTATLMRYCSESREGILMFPDMREAAFGKYGRSLVSVSRSFMQIILYSVIYNFTVHPLGMD